jgi:hypothetical protein
VLAFASGMHTQLLALARDPKFIPLVYNYCDMWCERCPITARCLLFACEQRPEALPNDDTIEGQIRAGLEFAQMVAQASGPGERTVAALDLRLASPATAPREPAIGHPLEYLARHYSIQASAFLSPLRCGPEGRLPAGSLELVGWYHTLIPAKTYRALISEHESSRDAPELLDDALGCARLVLVSIDRSIAAWHTIAATDGDGRIGAMIELLETLRTAVDLRFPGARAFQRPGLDQPLSAYASAADGSGDGSAAGCRASGDDPPPAAPRLSDASTAGSSS